MFMVSHMRTINVWYEDYAVAYREAHVRELFDQSVHDPNLILFGRDFALRREKGKKTP